MDNQQGKYNELYKEENFGFDLPDYKITNGKKVHGKKMLVLGVGTARDIRYLVKDNDVWGADFSESAVKTAKKFGIKAKNVDFGKLVDYENDFFDLIVVKDVLEHLDNPEFLLKQCSDWIKKTGYIVVSVPNHFYFPFRLRILFGGNLIWKTPGHDHTKLFEEWNYMHKVFFTWKGFQKFIKKSGFHITKAFWDFGTLGHYSQPEMVFSYIEQTQKKSLKRDLLLNILKICWGLFNFVFPRNIRSKIVSLDPAFFSAGFYVWCKPQK